MPAQGADGSFIKQCSKTFGTELCTEYVCDYNGYARLDTTQTDDSFRWANTKICLPRAPKPPNDFSSKPQQQVQTALPEPIAYDGVPTDYQMDSFVQPFEQCESDIDTGNRVLRDRQLWNERGDSVLSEVPEYKSCGPDKVQLERNGIVVSRDGMPNTANNLPNSFVESDLKGLNRYNVLGDTGIMTGSRQVCAARPMDSRAVPTLDLLGVYAATAFKPERLVDQLCVDPNEKRNCLGSSYRFNNSSRQRCRVVS